MSRPAALLPLLMLLSTLFAGCCAPRPERVILLPGDEGARTGALLVQRPDGATLRLAQPYAQAEVPRQGPLKSGASSAAEVQRDFAALLAIQPPRARSFFVSFLSNSNSLTAETQPVLDEVRRALDAMPAGELVVIGHTDGVGSEEANDRLSLERANAVRELLAAMGVPRGQISVEARGMREPLVAVPPQTAEPRNRRVEIKLR